MPCSNRHEPFRVSKWWSPWKGEVRSGAGVGQAGNEANLKKLDKVGQRGGSAQGRAAAFSKKRLRAYSILNSSGGGGEERRLGFPPPSTCSDSRENCLVLKFSVYLGSSGTSVGVKWLRLCLPMQGASQVVLVVKKLPASARDIRDVGSIPGVGGSHGGGYGNSLQYSGLEKPTDRGAWWSTVHKVTKSWTRLEQLSTHTSRGCRFDPCLGS